MLQNITDNSFSAAHIYNGLKLSQFDREMQEKMCKSYRRWRNLGMKPKESYDLVLYGLEPEDAETRNGERMKAWILPLEGKYYGTQIQLENESILEVWLMDGWKPSKRQLEKWDMTYEEAQEDDQMCDSHYETEFGFSVAEAIVDALQKVELPK
jgi:hypothetical protein